MTPPDTATLRRAAADEPEWRAAARRQALARVEGRPLPTVKDELWKYVELDFELDDYAPVTAPGSAPGPGEVMAGAPALTVVDGTALGDGGAAGGGVSLTPLGAAVAAGHAGLDALLAPGLASDADVFAAAHTAFGGDGALVEVARGVTADPVVVRLHSATHRGASYPTVVVHAAEAAEASVVVDITSSDVDALTVPHLEVVAGPASIVKLSVIQHLGPQARQIATLRATVERDATLAVGEAGLGGRLARLQLNVDLVGRGSSAEVIGAYFGDGEQVIDYRYFMHHVGVDTRSDMFLKGAVEDRALSVFTGLIRIEEGAQRTDAFQTNRNLILSEGAAAQSVPNLEILANDVKCGHGSSVGPLDDEQRYYLMSRGLDRRQADRLQVRGFFEQALARFPHREVTAAVREWVNAKYVSAQEEGRV